MPKAIGRYDEGSVIVVILTPADDAMGDAFLPPTTRYATGRGLMYRFYRIEGALSNRRFDDIDGTPLVEYRSFATQEDAEAWVTADFAWRTAQPDGVS